MSSSPGILEYLLFINPEINMYCVYLLKFVSIFTVLGRVGNIQIRWYPKCSAEASASVPAVNHCLDYLIWPSRVVLPKEPTRKFPAKFKMSTLFSRFLANILRVFTQFVLYIQNLSSKSFLLMYILSLLPI